MEAHHTALQPLPAELSVLSFFQLLILLQVSIFIHWIIWCVSSLAGFRYNLPVETSIEREWTGWLTPTGTFGRVIRSILSTYIVPFQVAVEQFALVRFDRIQVLYRHPRLPLLLLLLRLTTNQFQAIIITSTLPITSDTTQIGQAFIPPCVLILHWSRTAFVIR